MAASTTVRVKPLTGTFGAEITDVDIRKGFRAGELLALLETHLVVVARGQDLSLADQVEVARSLGEPTPAHPVVPGHPDYPEVLILDSNQGGKNARWHTERHVRTDTSRRISSRCRSRA